MIRASVKRLVRSIYVMRCGYCQVAEVDIGAELTFDHFQPQTIDGSNEVDNLVYACHACNEFKGDYFGDNEETRLLHPLRDDLTLHLRQSEDSKLEGITSAGLRYIKRLQLNRPPLVLYRRNQRKAEQSSVRSEAINSRLDQVIARIEQIEMQLRSRRN